MTAYSWFFPIIGAWFVWGFWGFFPKQAGKFLAPVDILIWEVVGAIILGTGALIYTGFRLNFHPVGSAYGVAAGFCGYLGTLFFLHALKSGPVSLVVAISALYPILTIVMAYFFLHEPITLRQFVGIGLAMAAVVLIST